MTLRLKTNGRSGGFGGQTFASQLRRLIPSLTGILLENTLRAAETMQTSWGSYGRSERPAHTAFDPHLAAERLRHMPAGQHPTPIPPPRQPAGGRGGGGLRMPQKCLEMWASGPESSPGKSASINVPGICHINTRPDVGARFPGGQIRAVIRNRSFPR